MENMGEQLVEKVSTKTHIPVWGVIFTLVVLLGFAVSVFYCCCQRWWRRLRGKDGAKGVVGGKVDIRSVQLLGQTYKEKVTRLDSNMLFNNENNDSFLSVSV